VLDGQLGHREIDDVRCRQPCPYPDGCRRNEAVGLVKGDSPVGELTSPRTGANPFGDAQWSKPESVEQTPGDGLLIGAKAAPDLLDRDRAHPGFSAGSSQRGQPRRCGTAPQSVDENRRVQQKPGQRLPSSPYVAPTLLSYPGSGILVPLVAGVGKSAKGRLDVIPAPLVIESAPDQLRDETTAASRAYSLIEFSHEGVVQRYVHSHVPKLAHRFAIAAAARQRSLRPAAPPPRRSAAATRGPRLGRTSDATTELPPQARHRRGTAESEPQLRAVFGPRASPGAT
jgi:hypothetical protein